MSTHDHLEAEFEINRSLLGLKLISLVPFSESYSPKVPWLSYAYKQEGDTRQSESFLNNITSRVSTSNFVKVQTGGLLLGIIA